MINYIYTIFWSRHPDVLFFKWLLIVGGIYLWVLVYKKDVDQSMEGFTQSAPFILKRGQDAYDDFYVDLYDALQSTSTRTNQNLIQILKMTEPTTKHSVFLDVGCGTGYLVHQLHEAGYRVYGIDISPTMINYARTSYPACEWIQGSVLDPMAFESKTFTHIVCTHFTVYQFADKAAFFSNCFRWLQSNGYLILHLVNPSKFDTILPLGRPTLLPQPQTYSKTRITDTLVEFDDFSYRTSYSFPSTDSSSIVLFRETFTDKFSSNVRQNEQTLYMEDMDTIVSMALEAGFILKGKAVQYARTAEL